MLGIESRITQLVAQSLNRPSSRQRPPPHSCAIYPYIEVNKHDVAVHIHILQVRNYTYMQFRGEKHISSAFMNV